MNNEQLIAIKITNPAQVAKSFGCQAGDFVNDGAQWWVGTRKCLTPRRDCPVEAKVVVAPVRYCGGEAWVQTPTTARKAIARAAGVRRFSSGDIITDLAASVGTGFYVRNARAEKRVGRADLYQTRSWLKRAASVAGPRIP